MFRTHYSSQISDNLNGKKVTVAGWVEKIRDLGKVKFLMIRDRDGTMQVTVKDDPETSVFEMVKELSRESVVSVAGTVNQNAAAPNEYEIIPSSMHILSKAEAPLPLETDPKIKSELETRLTYRFLDLRRKEIDAIFKIKDVVHRSFVRYFENLGFILMHPPCIVAASTEGGTNLFPISYFENEAFLSQSPQLYKQMLMASGLDNVVIVTPVWRAEEHNTTRHLNESTQMDIETAFVHNEEDALKYAEGVLSFITKEVNRKCGEQLKALNRTVPEIEVPIPRVTYDECVEILNKEGTGINWGDDIPPEGEKIICKQFNPVFITKWPTDIRAFYSMPEPGNEKISRAYDMFYNGAEVLSGAQRLSDHKKLVAEMERRGMNPKNFTFYLDAFRYGMPQHAGWSFGLERLTAMMLQLKNIREATLWPRDRTRLTP